jgi:Flp pilus assembly protein CpaB
MRSRGLVVAIAVVLAIVAAAAVILYTNGVKNDAVTGGALSVVVVSTQDIAANTSLDPLLDQGAFAELRVPTDAVVDGAVTNPSDLRGQTATAPILANEQIPLDRLSGGEGPAGGTLGISKDNVAVTVALDTPQGGAGTVNVGDNVVVYGTFQDVKLIPGDIRKILAGTAPTSSSGAALPDFTATIVPEARVLRIQNPVVSPEGRAEENDKILLTLDLSKEDAQAVVFAQENGLVYTSLLAPGEAGESIVAATVPTELLLRAERFG